MVIKLTISKSAITEDFILKLWEAGSDTPQADVWETTLVEKDSGGTPTAGAGHQVDEAIVANGLDNVVHIARLYGATSGNLYFGPQNIEPGVDTVTIFSPIRFKIGDGGANTPAAGQPDCVTPDLTGLNADTDFVITRNNYGDLFPGIHFTFDSSSATWSLLNGDVFNDMEEFTIIRQPSKITTVVNDSVVGKWFGGFVDVNSNISFDATHLRKLIRFNATANYSFDTPPPIGYGIVFQNFKDAATGTVKFNNAGLKWGSTTKASIDLPPYSEACFTWDGTNWNVVYLSQSSWINNTTTIQPGTTISVGETLVGDVAGGDPIFTVTHNLNISGDYKVFLSIRSNAEATYFRNNKVGSTWWHMEDGTKKDRFKFSLQEISGETQNLSVSWLIVKA